MVYETQHFAAVEMEERHICNSNKYTSHLIYNAVKVVV